MNRQDNAPMVKVESAMIMVASGSDCACVEAPKGVLARIEDDCACSVPVGFEMKRRVVWIEEDCACTGPGQVDVIHRIPTPGVSAISGDCAGSQGDVLNVADDKLAPEKRIKILWP